jgi:two-component sensor histidine kinase
MNLEPFAFHAGAERGSLLIEIMDDGVGPPSNFRAFPKSETGAGARLMSGIANDLGAYLTFEKSDPGQIVRLEIPAPTERGATIEGQEGRSRTGRAQ